MNTLNDPDYETDDELDHSDDSDSEISDIENQSTNGNWSSQEICPAQRLEFQKFLAETKEKGILTPPIPSLRGKNGHRWSTTPPVTTKRTSARNIVHVVRGPKAVAKNAVTPLQCWELFFSDAILNKILVHTNEKIELMASKFQNQNATVQKVSYNELRALLGLLYFTAALKDNHLSARTLFNSGLCGNQYKACLSSERFSFLLWCLRFDDSKTRDERMKTDRFAPVREVWEIFIENCRNNYKPGSFVTIDEQLLAFRGRCSFRMYMPNKPAKNGIKTVMMCDTTTNYLIDAIPYLGKNTNTNGMAHGEFFVKKLTESIHGSNRNVTMDNWFTSVPLALDLLKPPFNLTMVGTIRANKREIPREMLNVRKRKVDTSLVGYDRELTLTSYKAKKNKVVLLLSTMNETVKADSQTFKPDVADFYNSTKGAVDTFDQLCSLSTCNRKTPRWPNCFVYGMLNSGGINSETH
uniref:CSON015446 protein n=1 Tax=Culicoides sonorensis TaxID=179676 RepID=A0A336MIT5_CULSO